MAVELSMEILSCRVAEVGSSRPALGEMPMGMGPLLQTGTLALEVSYRVVVREMRVIEEHPARVEFSV